MAGLAAGCDGCCGLRPDDGEDCELVGLWRVYGYEPLAGGGAPAGSADVQLVGTLYDVVGRSRDGCIVEQRFVGFGRWLDVRIHVLDTEADGRRGLEGESGQCRRGVVLSVLRHGVVFGYGERGLCVGDVGGECGGVVYYEMGEGGGEEQGSEMAAGGSGGDGDGSRGAPVGVADGSRDGGNICVESERDEERGQVQPQEEPEAYGESWAACAYSGGDGSERLYDGADKGQGQYADQ